MNWASTFTPDEPRSPSFYTPARIPAGVCKHVQTGNQTEEDSLITGTYCHPVLVPHIAAPWDGLWDDEIADDLLIQATIDAEQAQDVGQPQNAAAVQLPWDDEIGDDVLLQAVNDIENLQLTVTAVVDRNEVVQQILIDELQTSEIENLHQILEDIAAVDRTKLNEAIQHFLTGEAVVLQAANDIENLQQTVEAMVAVDRTELNDVIQQMQQPVIQQIGGGRSSSVRCPHCALTFINNDNLKKHVKNKHSKVKCPECGLQFDNRMELENHKKHCEAPGMPILDLESNFFNIEVSTALQTQRFI